MYGAVSELCEECKSCPVRTGRLLVGHFDPLFVPTSVMNTSTPSTDDPAQEEILQKYQERKDKLTQQDRLIKNCTDAGFLKTVEVGQYVLHDTDEFSQFTESGMSWVHFTTRWRSSDPKGWIRGNTIIGPVLVGSHSQLLARFIGSGTPNCICEQRQFSLVCQIFSWIGQGGFRFDRQSTTTTSWKPLNRRRKYLRWRRKYLCKLFKGHSKTERTFHYFVIYKKCTCSWKNMDWYWTMSSIRSNVPSGLKIEHSSSARRNTLRKEM